ncbi:LacI family DNA-binding transcriptional regulator [Pelagovum pacificum]|nr:LacI family DNA-binding transcriptional regulator [Pelagovum pacificum]
MSDVAKAAKVSKTTVSLVLNEIPGTRIPDATRARVRRAAEKLEYRHPSLSRRPDRSGTRIIGVLINELSNRNASNLMEGVMATAADLDYQVVVQMTDGRADREKAALENLRDLGITEVVYALTYNVGPEPTEDLRNFRHVFLNCQREDGIGTSVMPDHYDIGYQAARHLVSLNRERISTLTGDPWQIGTRLRLSGFLNGLAESGLTPFHVEVGRSIDEAAKKIVLRLMKEQVTTDAIYCQNDMMALGALEGLEDVGCRVPDDVAVIGCEDRDFARLLRPPLTTFMVPEVDMGRTAVELLISGDPLPDEPVILPVELLARGTA